MCVFFNCTTWRIQPLCWRLVSTPLQTLYNSTDYPIFSLGSASYQDRYWCLWFICLVSQKKKKKMVSALVLCLCWHYSSSQRICNSSGKCHWEIVALHPKKSLRCYSTAGACVHVQPWCYRVVGGWKHNGISVKAGVSGRQPRNKRSTNTKEFSTDPQFGASATCLVSLQQQCSSFIIITLAICFTSRAPTPPQPPQLPTPTLHIPTWFALSPTLAEWPLTLHNLIYPWLKEALGWAMAPWII